jgi:3-hydroxyisobutyrate dehydrogenase-like beta-hydroxyacid dehydrogenase
MAFADTIRSLGSVVRVLDDKPGTAAQLKMLRSLAMKSMGMVILESVLAGAALGIREETYEAIRDSMDGVGFAAWTKMGMQTNGLHARRRADEMGMAINLLRSSGVDPVMASATKERLERLLDVSWPAEFQEEWPEDYEKVLPHYAEVRRPWPGLDGEAQA